MPQIDNTAGAIKAVEDGLKHGNSINEAFQNVDQYLEGKKLNPAERAAEVSKITKGLELDGVIPQLILTEGKKLLQEADLNQDQYVDRGELKTKIDSKSIGGSHRTDMESMILNKMQTYYDQLTTAGYIYGENGISQQSLDKYVKEQGQRRAKDESVVTKLDGLTDAVMNRWGDDAGFKELTGGESGLSHRTLDRAAKREQQQLDRQESQLRELEARAKTRTDDTLKAKDQEEIAKAKDDCAFKEKLVKGLHVLSENFNDLKDENGVITRDRLQAISDIAAHGHEAPQPPQEKAKATPDERSANNEKTVEDQSVKSIISTLASKGKINETIKGINESIMLKVPPEHRDAVAANIMKELNDKGEGASLRVAYLKQNSSSLDADHNKRLDEKELKRAYEQLNGNGNGLFTMDAAIMNDEISNFGSMSDKVTTSKGRYSHGGTRNIGISDEGLDKYEANQSKYRANELIEKQRKSELEEPAKKDNKVEAHKQQEQPASDALKHHQETEPKEPKVESVTRPDRQKAQSKEEGGWALAYRPESEPNEPKVESVTRPDRQKAQSKEEGGWALAYRPESEPNEPKVESVTRPDRQKAQSKETRGESEDLNEATRRARFEEQRKFFDNFVAEYQAHKQQEQQAGEALKSQQATEALKQQQETAERSRRLESAKLESGNDIQAIIKAALSTKDVENRHYIYTDENHREIKIPVNSAAGRAYEKWYGNHGASSPYHQQQSNHHCHNGMCS